MSGKAAPPKPWERRGGAATGSSSSTPLGPSTATDGAVKPWEAASTGALAATDSAALATRNRPWDTAASTSGYNGYGGYGAGNNFGSGYGTGYGTGGYGGGYGAGSSMYGRPAYGSYNSPYSAGLGTPGGFGGGYMNRFGSGYGASGYGSYGMGGGYGMGNYGGSYGGYGGMGGYGMNGFGAAPGPMDGPPGAAPPPPSAWQHMLHAIGGVVGFFGRLSFLVDENAHAFHFFISSLLQLLDRAGSLYGELARFVLRLLGYKGKAKEAAGQEGRPELQHGQRPTHGLPGLPAPRQPASQNFDSVWQDK